MITLQTKRLTIHPCTANDVTHLQQQHYDNGPEGSAAFDVNSVRFLAIILVQLARHDKGWLSNRGYRIQGEAGHTTSGRNRLWSVTSVSQSRVCDGSSSSID